MGNEERAMLLGLWLLAFGDEEGFADLFFTHGFSEDRYLVLHQDGRIAAALYWFDCSLRGEKMAYLYGVATHPDYRNRGLCRTLMEKAHEHLLAQGYDSCILVPQKEPLRQMYEKMGYRTCSTVSEYTCEAEEKSCWVRRVSPEGYGILRRMYLPEGGVRQEGDTLPFLGAQAELYEGADFLLAAYREGDTLHGMELLGNRQAAPGILKALGFRRGCFRTPGEGRPFAMFHPLKEGAQEPRYFGLAFD